MLFSHAVPGERHPEPGDPAKVRVPVFRVPTWMYVLWLIGKAFCRVLGAVVLTVVYLVKFWWLAAPVLTVTVLSLKLGPMSTIVLTTLAGLGLAGWRYGHRRSFLRWVGYLYQAKWVQYTRYRKLWQPTMTTLGLATTFGGDKFYPTLVKVRTDAFGDRVWVRMLPGQHPDDWASQGSRFAHTFHALSCAVAPDRKRKGRLVLRLRHHDPLQTIVAPLPVPVRVDVRRLPVAVDEDGHVFTASLIGHVLLAGRTGAGKGSVLWALLAALAAGCRDGLVQVHAFDPKGGMELVYGQDLFTAFHYGRPEVMAGALEDIAKTVVERADRYRGVTRDHTATVAEPAIVIVIDELASLTAYAGDKKARDRINHVLPEILSKGRAVGVHVIAALQDPRKEILSYRNMFATRIALALNEQAETDMVLGDKATERGAGCHQIPESTPGVGYVRREANHRLLRVRFPYHTDTAIQDLATRYACPQPR